MELIIEESKADKLMHATRFERTDTGSVLFINSSDRPEEVFRALRNTLPGLIFSKITFKVGVPSAEAYPCMGYIMSRLRN